MQTKLKGVLIIGGVILAMIGMIVVYTFSTYNSFVSSEENIDGQWAQVENQLQRRFDLIPNLVNTAKGYAAHEEELFMKLAELRTEYGAASSIDEKAATNDELSRTLSNLLVVVENYPELKSNEQFNKLMVELAGTENRIAVARKDYNEVVQEYNSSVRKVPGSLFAGMFGFEQKDYFEIEAGVEAVPTVNFEE